MMIKDCKITTYPYGTNAFKVCESEMLMVKRFVLWNIKNDQLW